MRILFLFLILNTLNIKQTQGAVPTSSVRMYDYTLHSFDNRQSMGREPIDPGRRPSDLRHSDQTSLQDTVQWGLEWNPTLQTEFKEWKRAQTAQNAAKSLPDPHLGLNLMEFRSLSPFISQTFPYPEKLSARERTAFHESERQRARYRQTEIRLIAEIKESYFELAIKDLLLETRREIVSLLEKTISLTETSYKIGKARRWDILKARLELSKAKNAYQKEITDRKVILAKLNTLLARPTDTPLIPSASSYLKPLSYQKAECQEIALSIHPELEEAYHHRLHQEYVRNQINAEYLPDVMIQYGILPGMPSMEPGMMIQLSLPFLWSWSRAAVSQEALQQKEAAQEMEKARTLNVLGEVDQHFERTLDAYREMKFYETELNPQAQEGVKLAEISYQTGNTSLLEFIEAIKDLLEIQESTLHSYFLYLSAFVKLEAAVGKELISPESEVARGDSLIKGDSHD